MTSVGSMDVVCRLAGCRVQVGAQLVLEGGVHRGAPFGGGRGAGISGAQAGQPAGGGALDGADGDAEHVGGGLLGQVAVVAQHDDLALLLGQGGQQPDDVVAVLGGRATSWCGLLGKVGHQVLAAASCATGRCVVDQDAAGVGEGRLGRAPGATRRRCCTSAACTRSCAASWSAGQQPCGAQQRRRRLLDERRERGVALRPCPACPSTPPGVGHTLHYAGMPAKVASPGHAASPPPLRWPRGDRPAHPLDGERRHRGPGRGRASAAVEAGSPRSR